MGKYEIEMHDFGELNEKVTLPSYQRPVVWTKSERQNFIENLHKGFPFGSLLLYRDFEGDGAPSLVDGQQRLTTMRDYAKNPEEYFPIGDFEFIDEIFKIVDMPLSQDQQEDLKVKFLRVIEELLKEDSSNPKDLSPFFLRDQVLECLPSLKSDSGAGDSLLVLQKSITDEFHEYLDVDSIKIPCVFFTGDESDLPEVFASVNLGGRKLTKYQVYAAQWSRHAASLSDSDIASKMLERVIKRYVQLTDDRGGVEIENFDAKEMRSERVLNLPELCHALGQEIFEVTPACWPKNDRKQDDKVDTIGYNTLAITFGLTQRDIGKLAPRFEEAGYCENPGALDSLMERIIGEYRVINDVFARYLHKPGKGPGRSDPDDFENTKAMSALQFLSFFAALWQIKYGYTHQGRDPLPKYKDRYDQTVRNLFSLYLQDTLNHQWKGSGDSRLARYITGDSNYLVGVTEDSLNAALNNWSSEETSKPSVNIDATTKILLTVFASSKPDEFQCESYDYEHIISRNVLNGVGREGTPRYKELTLPGGRLGNIMLLDSSINRGKHEKSLGSYAGEELDIKESRQFVPKKEEVRNIEYAISNGDRDRFMQMVKSRQLEIFAEIVKFVP